MKTDYKKSETSNMYKAYQWIVNAMKGESSIFFRYVSINGSETIYTDWMTPENAKKEIASRNEYNTFKVEKRLYK